MNNSQITDMQNPRLTRGSRRSGPVRRFADAGIRAAVLTGWLALMLLMLWASLNPLKQVLTLIAFRLQ
jgi:hypothetical protein